jgi:hypothetical protein
MKILVKRNIWGNYSLRIGSGVSDRVGNEWDALEWVRNKISEGYIISEKSDVTQSDVNIHLAKFQ